MSSLHFTLEKFSGPLDLLLGLIDDRKFSITELALSEVTEQYLRHMQALEEERPDELADFLVIATRLLLLKSKMLLPQFAEEEEEDGESLEKQLRLYQAFRAVSRQLEKLWLSDSRSFFRFEPPRLPDVILPPVNATVANLEASMRALLLRLKPPKELPKIRLQNTVSLKERIEQLKTLLEKAKKISFLQTLQNPENRSEIIISFLALLELVKQKNVSLHQEENFSDIAIKSLS